jgi:hypothetical protein
MLMQVFDETKVGNIGRFSSIQISLFGFQSYHVPKAGILCPKRGVSKVALDMCSWREPERYMMSRKEHSEDREKCSWSNSARAGQTRAFAGKRELRNSDYRYVGYKKLDVSMQSFLYAVYDSLRLR